MEATFTPPQSSRHGRSCRCLPRPVAAVSLGSLLALLALAPCAQAQPAEPGRGREPRPPLLVVTGSATVEARPDEATVRLGVVAQAPTATAAQQQVNTAMQRVIAAVKQLGLPEKQIQTAGLSLGPVYQQDPEPRAGNTEAPAEPKIIAYRASNTVAVRTGKLEQVGDVIDAATEAGANTLEGISFGLKDDAAARREALTHAVEAARADAQTLAQASGVELAGIDHIRESGAEVYPAAETAAFGLRMARAGTPVQPGQVSVNASVMIRYRIRGTGAAAAASPKQTGRNDNGGGD